MKRMQLATNHAPLKDNFRDDRNMYDVLSKTEDERQRYEEIDIVEGKPTIARVDGESAGGTQNLLESILRSQKQILEEMTSLRLENRLLRETLEIYRGDQDRTMSSVQDQIRKASDHQIGQLADLRREVDTALNVSLFDFMDKQEKFTLSVLDHISETDDRLNEKLIDVNRKLDAVMLNKSLNKPAKESSSSNDSDTKKQIRTKKKSSSSDLPSL